MKTKGLCASLVFWLSLACLIGPAASRARAQVATGAILGTVTDPSGAVVPDAEVTITNSATGSARTVQTDAAGRYDVEALQASGTLYNVAVKKQGFRTFTSEGVRLDPSARVLVNATLQVGSAVSEVTVTASSVLVNTQSGESGGTIQGTEVQNLQLNGRDWRDLAMLVPGVNNLNAGMASHGGGLTGGNGLSVNGLDTNYNMYTTDGAFNMNTGCECNENVLQPVDSIAEFRVVKDNYSARHGIAGGAQFMVATKSGTRQFHGSAYEYLRNDWLDARNFFTPTTPILKQNIFGGNIGGPIFIPGKYNTDRSKTFFFANQEYRIRHVGVAANGAMIPQAMRNGDFTKSPTLGTGGLKLDATSTSILSQLHPGVNCLTDSTHLNPACFDPNAVALMNRFWPLPNNPAAGFLNYLNTGADAIDGQDYTYRIDQYFGQNQKYSLMARVSYETTLDSPPYLAWGNNPAPTATQTIGETGFNNILQFTANISPTTISQSSWTQTHDKPRLLVQNIFLNGVSPGLTINMPFGIADFRKRVPQISLSGGWAGVSDASLPEYASDGEQLFAEDFTKIRGSHTLQMGTMYIFGIKRQDNFATPEGSYSFSGVHANDPVADYLLGLDASFFQSNTRLRGYFRYRQSESYIQDDWKVTGKLTLNLGLRATYFSSDKMEGNGVSDFDLKRFDPSQTPVVQLNGTLLTNALGQPVTATGAVANLLNGLVFPEDFKARGNIPGGTPGVPDGIFTTSMHFGPRIGFAYDFSGSGKTVVRGGYGIGYGRVPFAIYNQDLGNYPFQTGITLLNGTLTSPSLGTPGAVSSSPLGTVGTPGQEFKPTRIQTYSLTLERQVIPNGVLSFAYVGSTSSNVSEGYDINFPLPVAAPSVADCLPAGQAIPAGGFQFDPCLNAGSASLGSISADYTRRFKGWSSISSGGSNTSNAAQFNGHSYYSSLQAGFQYRAGHGLTFTTAYTYGRTLSNGQGPQNPRNFAAEYGRPYFDRGHMFTASYVYDLPIMRARSDLVGKALGGWTFSGITVIQSGTPITIGLSTATPGLAGRPNCIAGVGGPKTASQWFNINAFAAPAFGFFGNCANGNITGPGMSVWDWALYKTFPLRERLKMQIRAEAFNIWNHTNFNSVCTGLGSGCFGQLTGALDPRQLEFAVRFDF